MEILLGELHYISLADEGEIQRSQAACGITQIFNGRVKPQSQELKNFNCHPRAEPITKGSFLMNHISMSTD